MSVQKLYKYQLIAKTVCSSVSLFFSGVMVYMIILASSQEKILAAPYSRIIFFLSIGDIIFSLSLVLGPHLLPQDSESAIWAKGNVATCDAVGFLAHTGTALNQLYTLALSYYFLKRVKDKVKPHEFAKKYERLMHAVIWTAALVPNIIAISREDFNPVETGDLCVMIDKPIDCSLNDDVECTRGESANRDAILFAASITFVVFILIIFNFSRLTIHVYRAEKMMRLENTMQNGREQDTAKYSFCKEITQYFFGCCFRKSEKQSHSLAFESFVQSGLWVAIFLIIYIPTSLVFGLKAIKVTRPPWLFWFPSILTPLGGAFNIFIYTRPKVQKTRRVYPQLEHAAYWVLFLIVVLSGGECPKEIDFATIPRPNHLSSPPAEEEKEKEEAREKALREMIGNENIADIFSSDFWLKQFGVDALSMSEISKVSNDSDLSSNHLDIEDSGVSSLSQTFHK